MIKKLFNNLVKKAEDEYHTDEDESLDSEGIADAAAAAFF